MSSTHPPTSSYPLNSGTLRENLDPTGMHDDAAIWSALRAVQMEEQVRLPPTQPPKPNQTQPNPTHPPAQTQPKQTYPQPTPPPPKHRSK